MSLINISNRISIDKGWSGDRKYRITDDEGRSYLLRISPAEKAETIGELFKLMQQLARLGIPMCRPVEYGTGPEGSYSIHTWIDGRDAEEVIPALA
ncbi:MAG: aminoglycoside phosphotransferase family protein, partial [Clostridiaceae bacterium]|nr:aminoglycoside phosphotransferase family protein [Clostridiaceae bacterium]